MPNNLGKKDWQQLKLQVLSWLDTGTHKALAVATDFVKVTEKQTRLKITCIEEIDCKIKFIDDNTLKQKILEQ